MVMYCEPEDVQSLADAICRVHASLEPQRRRLLRPRTFLARYGWEQQGEELVAMYRTLVGELN